jgi:hypothetical protein
MPTVAILISGNLRSYNNTRDNILENIVNPLKESGYEVNIYSSLWKSPDDDYGHVINDSKVILIEESKQEYFLKNYMADYWHPRWSGPLTCVNATSMWYMLYRCHKLLSQETCDYIIRVRPDLWFNTKFNPEWLTNATRDTVYTSNWHGKFNEVTYGVMDHFAFGTTDSMKVYCSIFTIIPHIMLHYKNIYYCTAEGFMFVALGIQGVRVDHLDIHYDIMRQNNVRERVV